MRHRAIQLLFTLFIFAFSKSTFASISCQELLEDTENLYSRQQKLELQTVATYQTSASEVLVNSPVGITIWDRNTFQSWNAETDAVTVDNMTDFIMSYATGIHPSTEALPGWVIVALRERHDSLVAALGKAHAELNGLERDYYYLSLNSRSRENLGLSEPKLTSLFGFRVNEYIPEKVIATFENHLADERNGKLQFPVIFHHNPKAQNEDILSRFTLGSPMLEDWVYRTLTNTSVIEARLQWMSEVNPEIPWEFLSVNQQRELVLFYAAYPELVDTIRVGPELGFDPSTLNLTAEGPFPQSNSYYLHLGKFPNRLYGYLTASPDLIGGEESSASLVFTIKKNIKNHATRHFNKDEERRLMSDIKKAWSSFSQKEQLHPSAYRLNIHFVENAAQIEILGSAKASERFAALAEFFVSISKIP